MLRITKTATGIAVLLSLGACAAQIDTHGADSQTAGRCKLMAHQEDRGSISFGLIPMAIAASNANARRQDVYDSCVAASGSRELPPETLLALPNTARAQ
jgi:hypothetical protein